MRLHALFSAPARSRPLAVMATGLLVVALAVLL